MLVTAVSQNWQKVQLAALRDANIFLFVCVSPEMRSFLKN